MVDAILVARAWRAGAVLAVADSALELAEQLVRSGAAVWVD